MWTEKNNYNKLRLLNGKREAQNKDLQFKRFFLFFKTWENHYYLIFVFACAYH